MAMNLTRTGTALVLGAASGGLEPPTLKALTLGSTVISWSTVVEALGLVAGAGLQLMAPFTMPSVADGLVDGGIALLARRGTNYAITRARPTTTTAGMIAPFAYGQQVLPAANGAALYGGIRPQVGAVSNVPKKTLT
jgi:hypothetical protein